MCTYIRVARISLHMYHILDLMRPSAVRPVSAMRSSFHSIRTNFQHGISSTRPSRSKIHRWRPLTVKGDARWITAYAGICSNSGPIGARKWRWMRIVDFRRYNPDV